MFGRDFFTRHRGIALFGAAWVVAGPALGAIYFPSGWPLWKRALAGVVGGLIVFVFVVAPKVLETLGEVEQAAETTSPSNEKRM